MGDRLQGKVALVTGAASGIGLGIARRYAAEGASIVAGDINEAGLADLARELGDRCVVQVCDVTAESDLETLAALAISRFGGLDVAVANAGRGHYAPIIDQTLEDWRGVIDLCPQKRYPDLPGAFARLG